MSPEQFMERLAMNEVPRVPGSAVFLTRLREPIPPVMVAHALQFGVLPRHAVTLTIEFDEAPRVPVADRITVRQHAGGVWHVIARYGFIEIPALTAALLSATEHGCPIVSKDAIFIGGRDEVVRDRNGRHSRLPGWRRMLFAIMYRNAVHLVDRFDLPPERFVQTGRQIAL